ncbi:uncharacterized protein LOC134813368 isoform X2 [Bolinopsis microptera]|uniref:uncharacterized protein LOC134813368 isoform X2 n=1 Tax=Bolinopsis microptera TaxID=2820187 RepID=UPI003079D8B5
MEWTKKIKVVPIYQTGTMNSHHAPTDIRRNFETSSLGSPSPENKKAPGYILDSGQPSKLERKWSKEKEVEDEKRRKKIKKFLVYFLTFLAVLITVVVIVLVLLYFLTCIFGNCPEGCYDCKYAEKSDWKRKGNSYSGKKRHCGDALKLHVTDNSFILDSSVKGSGGTGDMDTTAPLIHSFSSMVDEKETNTMELYWYMEQTVRNNDSLKLVFSDNGDRYAGLGDLGDAVFRPKGEEAHHTLWVNDDNPIYLPFYLSRNKESSLCMFADAGGAPMEVSVKGSRTEWLIYKHDKVYFHIYSASTSLKAMTKCTEKWRELYPSPDASWTDHFIIGSLSTDKIKAARNKDGILGTHYILAPDSISINDGDLKIENKDEISNYDKVFLPWTAKQNLKDSGYEHLNSRNGYFKTDEEDVYFLDYDNDMVNWDISSAISTQTMAGVILQNDFYHNMTPSETCPQYNYCSTNSAFFDWDSDLCMGDEFGEKVLFQRHNYYDTSRSKVVRRTSSMVVESVAAPGTTHFHRGNIELTPEGLSTCFHNILNLQLIGIRAVSCNMCGGLIPQETDIEQTRVCNRLSQLAFLMPYVIMTNDEEPPLITDEKDAGRYVKNNLNARKQFRYYLESAYKEALESNTPFVYTVGTAYNDDIYNDNQQAVIIGARLVYVVVLEDGGDLNIAFPPGYWSSNGGPLTGEYFAGGQDRVQSSTDMSNLIYFQAPGIFVLADSDNPNHAVVRVYLPFEGPYDQITHTFNYYHPVAEYSRKYSTQITFDPEDGANSANIRFSYDGESPRQDISVSRIEVYRWFVNNDSPPDWVAFNARGNNKFNVVFDYIQRKTMLKMDAQSLFGTLSWTQSFDFES